MEVEAGTGLAMVYPVLVEQLLPVKVTQEPQVPTITQVAAAVVLVEQLPTKLVLLGPHRQLQALL